MRKAVLLLLLCACAGPAPEDAQEAALRSRSVALPARVIPVPLVRQKTDYSGGAAGVRALLRYWENARYKEVSEPALYARLGTTSKNGTDPYPMAAYLDAEPSLSAQVLHTTPSIADLEAAIDRGEPPIVDLEAWQNVASVADLKPWATDWADGHYVVLIAYDADNFFFMDPSTGRHYAYIPRAEFVDRWHDVVGPHNRHTQHLAIFVHCTTEGWTPAAPLPPRATPID